MVNENIIKETIVKAESGLKRHLNINEDFTSLEALTYFNSRKKAGSPIITKADALEIIRYAIIKNFFFSCNISLDMILSKLNKKGQYEKYNDLTLEDIRALIWNPKTIGLYTNLFKRPLYNIFSDFYDETPPLLRCIEQYKLEELEYFIQIVKSTLMSDLYGGISDQTLFFYYCRSNLFVEKAGRIIMSHVLHQLLYGYYYSDNPWEESFGNKALCSHNMSAATLIFVWERCKHLFEDDAALIEEAKNIILRAIKVIISNQSDNGSWPVRNVIKFFNPKSEDTQEDIDKFRVFDDDIKTTCICIHALGLSDKRQAFTRELEKAAEWLCNKQDKDGLWLDDPELSVLCLDSINLAIHGMDSELTINKPEEAIRLEVMDMLNDKVFIIHGRNTKAFQELASFLSSLGLKPIEWENAVQLTKKPSPYIWEVVEAAFSHAQALIVLLTPDEKVELKEKFVEKSENPFFEQARANVIFEAGAALAKYPERTIFVQMGEQNIWSDIAGKITVRVSNKSTDRKKLANRLKIAGCSIVDIMSSDMWEKQGNLDL